LGLRCSRLLACGTRRLVLLGHDETCAEDKEEEGR
jgi:hypothetical protein